MVINAMEARMDAHEAEKPEPGTWRCDECGDVNLWERGRGKGRVIHTHCTACGLRRPSYPGPRKTR